MENNFKIQVVKNDEIDAFGAYASPSIKKNDWSVNENVSRWLPIPF
jgi:hypothetical protein